MAKKIVRRVGTKFRSAWTGDRNPAPPNRTSSGEARLKEPQPVDNFVRGASLTRDYMEWMEKTLRLKQFRRADLELYDKMDAEEPLIASTLDIYADNATQVGVTRADSNRGQDKIIQIVSEDEKVQDLLNEVRERLRLDRRAWSLARDLAKSGEVFEEVVVRQDLKIDRLKQLPARQMIRNEDDYGILDQKNAFLQVDDDFQQAVAKFEPWEVMHFRLLPRNEEKYGRSILHAIRRVFKQIQMMEDAMVLARLTRAHSKLVFKVDTGTLPAPMAYEYVQKVKNEHRKRRLIDPITGKLREDMNPLTAEEDIFMGVSKGSQGDVQQLYGDLNIGNLEDLYYFQDKMFGGMKVPKSYLGIERDINTKATLTFQDIQFARTVRRIQLAMRLGYHELFDLALLLEGGRLSNKALGSKYSVIMPGMQTIDEMREWEVARIQAEVARIYAQELYLDPVETLVLVLGMSREKAKQVFQGSKSEFNKIEMNKNAAKSSRAGEDKKFSQKVKEATRDPFFKEKLREAIATPDRNADDVVEDLRMLCEMKLERIAHEELLDRVS